MVKRDFIVPGNKVKVTRKMPDGVPAGPKFLGNLGVGEKLLITGLPTNIGGTNVVRVTRLKTDESCELIYAFITNFCIPVK